MSEEIAETTEIQVVENELLSEAIGQQKELGVELLKQLTEGFAPYFNDAQQLLETAGTINVTSEEDEATMTLARTTRLALQKVRTTADKKRGELKADALRYGNAVQGMFNILKMTISPTEYRLYEQERYKEIKETERRVKLREARQIALTPYVEFVPTGVDLGMLENDAYEKLYTGAKLQYEADLKAKQEAEEAQKKAEQEAEELRQKQEAERKKQEEARKKELAEAKAKAEQAEAKAKAEAKARQEAELKAKAEREKAEAETLKAKAEALTQANARQQAEAREQQARQEITQLKSQSTVKDSVDFVKSHKPEPVIELADTEKWDLLKSKLIDVTKQYKFKKAYDRDLFESVSQLIHKIIVYIDKQVKQENK